MEAACAEAEQLRREAATYRRFAAEIGDAALRQAAERYADEAEEAARVLDEIARHSEGDSKTSKT